MNEHKLSDDIFVINLISSDSQYHLRFRLYDHVVTKKWKALMLETVARKFPIKDNGTFFGRGIVDEEKVFKTLNENIEYHNAQCERLGLSDCKIPVRIERPVTQDRLNLIHDYFERYAEDNRFEDSKDNLQDINLNVHRLESCFNKLDFQGHIDILHTHRIHVMLEDDDYKLFTPHYKWGGLYLPYGMTGVPTINSFFMKSQPTPQNLISNGALVGFWGDIHFNEMDKLKEFLDQKGLDMDDPKSAIGYIPLGIIENVERIDREELLTQVGQHAFIEKFSFEKVVRAIPVAKESIVAASSDKHGVQASWPFDPEVLYHLDLVPYIDLKVQFNAKKLYQEAEKALAYYVPHRDYDQESKQTSGKWKSLALRGLFGDYTKTQYHTSYTFEGEPFYKNTAFAELCPETMTFLNSITDISKCERVRFMLLEPGASIKVHRDSQDRDVSFAVNISLNMPEECVFYAQLNKDGTENEFTVKLPFKDSGSVLLFNNAKYHKVINNSSTPRIHIIFHGPIKFNDEQLIKLARQQNGTSDYQELVRKLMFKKYSMGEELTKTPKLFNDWVLTGLRKNSIPDNYGFAIYDHDKYYDQKKGSDFYLKIRTMPTVFPLGFDLIRENGWDDYLSKCFDEGKEFAVLMASGTILLGVHSFIQHLVTNCQSLKSKGWPVAGHIMDFNDGKQLPYFHEQFLIVNLKVWNELGRIPLGPLHTDIMDTISDIEVSEDMIHDTYTPLYIKSSERKTGQIVRNGSLSWGSALIKKAIESGKGVLNLTQKLRNEKMYSYPRDVLPKAKEDVENFVSERLKSCREEVFYFNNEPLSVTELNDFKPNKIISVAAGFKPFQILRQFNADKKTEIHFLDFSKNALSYIEDLTSIHSYDSLVQHIVKVMEKGFRKTGLAEEVEGQLNGVLRSYFNHSKDELMRTLAIANKSTFKEENLITNEHAVSSLLEKGDKFVVWVSNAFYNNALYLILTPEQANERLFALVKSISDKTGLKVYRDIANHVFLFGSDLQNIQGMLTDGALVLNDFVPENWVELY
jgi:hypothetical protein